jgi:hypothetical protein
VDGRHKAGHDGQEDGRLLATDIGLMVVFIGYLATVRTIAVTGPALCRPSADHLSRTAVKISGPGGTSRSK